MKAKHESTTVTSQRASNLIVLVESEIKHKTLNKNIGKRELEAIFKKKKCPRKIVLLLAIYRGIDSEYRVVMLVCFFPK